MFYSQFILAKKGPLGTIWIAAHLERKLRKNQVADTDIGVSVDSILFPEVPIALRLSSHLLLGVVRIYSRKVNYLFHDCSEALLKIKQAFRSTAVDLPPEESTAPYHSITLPETFDLDDFELPDFGFSHGNYVDHHISTREQITLQDTADDMVFSTSQFGLDERFGDGDASQLALDFDEDMFLEGVPSPAHTTVLLSLEDDVCEPVKHQTGPSVNSVERDEDDQVKASITSMECDELQRDLIVTQKYSSAEHTEHFPSLSYDEQTDFNLLESGGNGSTDLIETGIGIPKLIKDSLPCTIDQEQLPDSRGEAFSPNVIGESGIHNEGNYPSPAAQAPSTPGLTEVIPARSHEVSSVANAGKDSLLHHGDTLLEELCNSMPSDKGSNGGNIMESLMPADTVDSSLLNGHSDGVMEIEQGANNVQIVVLNNASANGLQGLDGLPRVTVTLDSCDPKVVNSSEATGQEILEGLMAVKHVECKDDSAHHQIVPVVSAEDDAGTRASDIVLHPCNGVLQTTQMENLLDKSADEVTVNKVEDRGLDITQLEDAHAEESEYPQLETLCSAPPEESALPEDLVDKDFPAVDSSLYSEKGTFVGGTISGKKRMSMDSSPILPHGNPSKTSKFSQSARSVDFIPDDDDVLASILVGRCTPTFKIKSTPTAENLSSRHRRASVKASAQKRKVLLDDIMVLHGDIIRQQLTITEDIRRVRRKAPCTSLELWKIQKLASADDIFSEPLLNGVGTEITSLYNKAFVSTGEAVLSITSEGVDPVGYLEFPKEPSAPMVDEPPSNSLESICLQGEQSSDTVVANHNNLSHSSEGLQDPEGTLQQEPGICINVNSVTNGVYSDVLMDKDISAGSPVGEPLLGNETSCLSIHTSVDATDGTSKLDNSQSGTGTGGDGVGMTGTEKRPDYGLDKDAPIEGDMLMLAPDQNKHALDVGAYESIEDRHILGEKSNTLNTDRVSTQTDLQPQGLDIENGSSSTTIPGDVQYVHAVSNRNEILNSAGSASGNHEGNINTADECPRNDDVMISCGDMLPIEHVDADSREYEAQVDPMHAEDDSDQKINKEPSLDNDDTVQDASVGKCVDQFQVLGSVVDENTIEFLNEDDTPDVEEDGEPSTSTAKREKLEDNSGWSVRTRGVAKYLKSLFESIESNSNKLGLASQKTVPLDRLLAGKSRKEASRMFFETLVLKTRDYIHVEQHDPFDSINIGPKLKLTKSEF